MTDDEIWAEFDDDPRTRLGRVRAALADALWCSVCHQTARAELVARHFVDGRIDVVCWRCITKDPR